MNLPEKPSRNESQGSILGILRNYEPPPAPKTVKYHLQSVARELLPDGRVAICARQMTSTRVSVNYHDELTNARYGGLMMCCSVWNCPVCATRITEQRRVELQGGMDTHKGNGGTAAMMTVTIRHQANDDLAGLLTAIQDAMQRTKRGNPWTKFKRRHGIIGGVYSLEVTYGESTGWHPHRHELLLMDHAPDTGETQVMQDWLRTRYLKMLSKTGFDADWEHGLTLETDTVETYIAKFGREPYWIDDDTFRWTQAHEITKAPSKAARDNERMSPFGMLYRIAYESDLANGLGERFKEYAKAFYGKKQVHWWRGTKALLGVDEVPDGEVVNDLNDYAVLGYITRKGWERVLELGCRAELLRVAEQGSIPALRQWCAEQKISVEEWLPDDAITPPPPHQTDSKK